MRLAGVRDTQMVVTADVLGGEGRTTGRLFGDLRRGFGGAARAHGPGQGRHRDRADAAAVRCSGSAE